MVVFGIRREKIDDTPRSETRRVPILYCNGYMATSEEREPLLE